MLKPKSKIIVILGPTSSGKSDVAIRLARKLNGEIISADSRQIYRGLDIGTGKVEADHSAEIPKEFLDRKFYSGSYKNKLFISEGVPHYMIDITSPKTIFSAAQFKKKVDKIIPDILKRGKIPIICGGTGFWIKSIVDNVTYPEVKPDWKLRKKLSNYSAEKLFSMLKKLNPERAKNIDRHNKVRLIRAIEICKKLGNVPMEGRHPEFISGSRSRNEFGMTGSVQHDGNYDFLQIGIKLPKEQLHKNIKKRLQKRFKAGPPRVDERLSPRVEAGMIEEVEKLHTSGLSWKKIQSFGLGYFWIPLYLQNNLSREKLFEKIYQAEKNYAKRQMTWFRKDKRIKWLENYKDIEKETRNFIKR